MHQTDLFRHISNANAAQAGMTHISTSYRQEARRPLDFLTEKS